MSKIKDLSFSEMMQMQKEMHEIHKDAWDPLEKEYAKNSMLWMIEEIGESIAIIKKKGSDAIVEDAVVRATFLEEISDVLMYLNDTLLRYGVTPSEIGEAYYKKHIKNKGRHYNEEYAHLFMEDEE